MSEFLTRLLLLGSITCLIPVWGAQKAPKPAPTATNVRYGPHERNVLDFWKAKASGPTPLVVYIHGGAFRLGDKQTLRADVLRDLLDGGISVAAIHYRLAPRHPLPAAHHDARRAIQFLRSKAGLWNIDKRKVGAFGNSAGAQVSMYLAFHDDMAQPESTDPVERESTRLAYVATKGGQTTLAVDNVDNLLEWRLRDIPEYAAPPRRDDVTVQREKKEMFGAATQAGIQAIVEDVSALFLISADDPPIHMEYATAPGTPPPSDAKEALNWRIHHVRFGIELKKRMDALGVEADLMYPGAKSTYQSFSDFFLRKFAAR